MAGIQKNFRVTNGLEVNDNLIFADTTKNTVGIGTTITPEKLQVNGGIGATSLVLSGVGTIPTLNSTNAIINTGTISVGVVTSITGTGLTYTAGNFGTVNATTGNIVTGVVTTLSGSTATYTNGYFTTQNSGAILVDNLFAVNGITTNGTVTNLTGTAATIGTVKIAAGIVTSSSGIVTYYGDGRYLDISANPASGIGIGTTGGVVGYGITFLDLKGAGVSTTFYNNSVGIATIFFEGGGGGGGGAIGIGSTFPGTPLSLDLPPANGDLFFHINYGRTFIYYDEVALGVGATAVWIDAAPFNQGLDVTLAGIAFSMGSATNPSAYFEGYTTTGWFSPSPGQFGVVSVGNTILTVNPSGIVVTGIASATGFAGTYSGNLAVFSGNSTDNIVRITQAGAGNALVVEDSANPDTTPFVVTGIGSVGVGTNAPINTLDVHGTLRLARQDSVSEGGEIVFARASDNTNAWALDVSGSNSNPSFRITDNTQSAVRVNINSSGNLGIGSTATSKLHVFGDAVVTGVVTATTFIGNLTGNATSANTATTATNANNINISGTTSVDTTTSVVLVADQATGNQSPFIDSGLTYNANTNTLTATAFVGDGSQLTGVGGAASLTVLTSNTTLSKGNAYMLNASGLVLTLPASPSTGDAIDILNNVVGIHTIARNSSTIEGLAENMEVSQQGIKFKIWYTGSTWSLF